jgi:hypothetical protein
MNLVLADLPAAPAYTNDRLRMPWWLLVSRPAKRNESAQIKPFGRDPEAQASDQTADQNGGYTCGRDAVPPS